MNYFWQQTDFPNFHFEGVYFISQIQEFAKEFGEVNGLLVNVTEENKKSILLHILVSEAIKTSEIEGEYFSREDIMSSLQHQLGIAEVTYTPKDKKAQAISELMLQVRKDYQKPFSLEMLKQWHTTLMRFDKTVNEGVWRSSAEPMQIISGRAGNIEVHFEAPPSDVLPQLMNDFEQWYHSFQYHDLGTTGRAMLRAALVHLYFETLHPFEDGNGRIGRALAEKALSETLETPIFISLSKKIEENKQAYYEHLKQAQRKQEVTEWLRYFFSVIKEAQKEVKETVRFVVEKAVFFDRYSHQLNERQSKVLRKMTDKGKFGFEGGMTSKKYMSITKTSKATATRDLQFLHEIGALTREGEGRGVKYHLNWIVNKDFIL
ncbi:MAG: Fic family protein [Flavobacterium sp.]